MPSAAAPPAALDMDAGYAAYKAYGAAAVAAAAAAYAADNNTALESQGDAPPRILEAHREAQWPRILSAARRDRAASARSPRVLIVWFFF